MHHRLPLRMRLEFLLLISCFQPAPISFSSSSQFLRLLVFCGNITGLGLGGKVLCRRRVLGVKFYPTNLECVHAGTHQRKVGVAGDISIVVEVKSRTLSPF